MLPVEQFVVQVWAFISEPTSLFLLFLPLYVIWFGSRLGKKLLSLELKSGGGHTSVSESTGERTPAKEEGCLGIVPLTAILLPIFGSAVLLLLFFFSDAIFYIFLVLLIIGSITGITIVILPIFGFLYAKCNNILKGRLPTHFTWVRWLGNVEMPTFFAFWVSLLFIVAWLALSPFRHRSLAAEYIVLIQQDVIAVCVAKVAIASARIPDLRFGTIVLCLFFCYDIFWVFLSPLIFHQSVMAKVAESIVITERKWSLPILIEAPRVFSDGVSILGLGDIILPGVFIAYLYRYDSNPWKGYFVNALIGYAVGMFITQVVLYILKEPQPALLYLVPSVLIPTIVRGLHNDDLYELWTGVPERVVVRYSQMNDSERIGIADEENQAELEKEPPTNDDQIIVEEITEEQASLNNLASKLNHKIPETAVSETTTRLEETLAEMDLGFEDEGANKSE